MVSIDDTSRHRWRRFISILTFPVSNANDDCYSTITLGVIRTDDGSFFNLFATYRGDEIISAYNERAQRPGRARCSRRVPRAKVCIASNCRFPFPASRAHPTDQCRQPPGRRQHRFYGVRADRYRV